MNVKRRISEFGIKNCHFKKVDLRKLDGEKEFEKVFDIAICSEVIEHIINDEKLIKDIYRTLKKDGSLTSDNPHYEDSHKHKGPIPGIKEGSHVGLGYNRIVLDNILKKNGFELMSVNYCSGIVSQNINKFLKMVSERNYVLGRIIILPLKIIYPLFDSFVTKLFGSKFASICITAKKC